MTFWKSKALDMLQVLLGSPATEQELVILSTVALLTFVIVFSRLTKLMSFPLSGTALALAAGVLAAASAVAASAVATVYLGPMPFVRKMGGGNWLPFAAGFLGLIALAAPALRLTHRSRYPQNVTAMLLAVASVGAALALTHAVMGTVVAREKDFERTKERTATMNEFLGGAK